MDDRYVDMPPTIELRDAEPADWLELMFDDLAARGRWCEVARTPYQRQAGVDAYAIYSRLRRAPDGRAQFDVQNFETVRLPPHNTPRLVRVRGRATQMTPRSLDARLELETTVRDAVTNESIMPAGVYPPASGVRKSVLRLVAVGHTTPQHVKFNVALVASPDAGLAWILRRENPRMTTLDYDACARLLIERGYAKPSVASHALVDVRMRGAAIESPLLLRPDVVASTTTQPPPPPPPLESIAASRREPWRRQLDATQPLRLTPQARERLAMLDQQAPADRQATLHETYLSIGKLF